MAHSGIETTNESDVTSLDTKQVSGCQDGDKKGEEHTTAAINDSPKDLYHSKE